MSQNNTNRDEALSALEVLGFFVKNVRKNYREIVKEDPEASVESIIKSFKTYKIKFKKFGLYV
jgi:Holliday junction DNA helicase RuvA